MSNKLYRIYRVTNLLNGKIYIGYTSQTLSKRRYFQIKKSKYSKFLFHKAITKYGVENFVWDTIFSHQDETITKYIMETFYIIKYISRRNILFFWFCDNCFWRIFKDFPWFRVFKKIDKVISVSTVGLRIMKSG